MSHEARKLATAIRHHGRMKTMILRRDLIVTISDGSVSVNHLYFEGEIASRNERGL